MAQAPFTSSRGKWVRLGVCETFSTFCVQLVRFSGGSCEVTTFKRVLERGASRPPTKRNARAAAKKWSPSHVAPAPLHQEDHYNMRLRMMRKRNRYLALAG